MNLHHSILISAATLLFAGASASALTVPVADDTFSSSDGMISKLNGKSTALAVSAQKTAFVQFDLFDTNVVPLTIQPGNIVSATLRIYLPTVTTAGALSVHEVTGAWNERVTTFQPAFDSTPIATFDPNADPNPATIRAKEFVTVDVTESVRSTFAGTGSTNGFAIVSAGGVVTIGAKEGSGTGYPATLEIETNYADDGSGNYFVPATLTAAQIGIGTDTPQGALDVEGDATLSGNLRVGGTASTVNVNTNGFSNVTMTVQSAPGDTQQINALDENGAFTLKVGTFGLEVSVGDAFKPGGGSFAVLSDARLKKNVEPLGGALDRLLKLRSVTYEYKDPAADHELPGRQTGFIAQEVAPVFPEWVGEKADGRKFVAIRGFESLTVQALRELRAEKDAEIDALKNAVEELKAEARAQDERLTRLEGLLTPNTVALERTPDQ